MAPLEHIVIEVVNNLDEVWAASDYPWQWVLFYRIRNGSFTTPEAMHPCPEFKASTIMRWTPIQD